MVLLRLGFWQLERAALKQESLERFVQSESSGPEVLADLMTHAGAAGWHYRRVVAAGSFMAERQYLLDNRTHEGKAGYYVMTPFVSTEGAVIVNRGWIPVGADRGTLPALPVTRGAVSIAGRLVPPPSSGLLLGSDGYERAGWPRVVQTVELGRMATQLGVRLPPAVLQLDPDSDDCFTCAWRPVAGISPQRHRGYAVQWFSLAAALVGLMGIVVWSELRRGR